VRDYIEARLRIAGTQRKIFDDDAVSIIWEFSEHGVPRLINKICKLCLKAGETNEFPMITGEVASQIADRFQKLSRTRKPPVQVQEDSSEREPMPKAAKTPSSQKVTPKTEAPGVKPAPPEPPRMVTPERPTPRPIPSADEERPRVFAPERPVVAPVPPQQPVGVEPPRMVTPKETTAPIPPHVDEMPPRVDQAKVVPISRSNANYVPLKAAAKTAPTAKTPQPTEESVPVQQQASESLGDSGVEIFEEVTIGQQKVTLSIPAQAVRQAQMSNAENKNKLAGYWSAQVLKANPQVVSSSFADPVSLWFEVKNIILKKFEGSPKSRVKMN